MKIEDDLDNYIAQGGSKVRFISGDYGDGKTHFMSMARHLALKKQFAVSFVVLTREVPIHKFEIVYQAIVRKLTGNFSGTGIRSMLKGWLDHLSQVKEKEKSLKQVAVRSALASELRETPGMDINFANGLIALVNNAFAPVKKDEEDTREADYETLMHWFEGGKVTKRELKPFQIYEGLTKTNSRHFLNSLILFLRKTGHKGLILLLDEMETVMAQSLSIRNNAYENVRLLIDNSESAQYIHIFFSIIPDLLTAEKGFKSYDALWSRVRSIGDTTRLNYRGVLVDIHRTPLKPDELLELGRRLRTIHGIAYRWDSDKLITVKLLEDICTNQKRMGVLSEVRLYIKQVIRLLDMAEEQGQLPEEVEMTTHIQETKKQMDAEKLAQVEPSWDK